MSDRSGGAEPDNAEPDNEQSSSEGVEEQGPSPVAAALDKVKAAWAAYEAIVDWDDWGDTGEMDTDEFYAVWTAMDELDACMNQERGAQGSTFFPDDSAGQRAKVLDSASRVSSAYHAYLKADHVTHGNVGTRDFARAMNRALGIVG